MFTPVTTATHSVVSPLKSKSISFFQPKLTVNTPGDAHEQEADRVADQVMRMQESDTPIVQRMPLTPVSGVQRKCAECEQEEQEQVQRKETGGSESGGKSAPSIVSDVISSGGGQPMDGGTRQFMESRFGQDFGQVRIHTDSRAAESASAIQARAYTSGRDVVFGKGEYQPNSDHGKRLLAHELAHVGQQAVGNKEAIQRDCHDGQCNTCAGGVRDFWVTFYFRRRATQRTMNVVRSEINEAKRLLLNCCLNLKANFDWQLLPGGGQFDPININPDSTWHYTQDASDLGTGNTFAGSRGIPVLIVDEVLDSGGGFTMDRRFDTNYQGRTYAVLAVNQPNPNANCNHLAHELWHVAGNLVHDANQGGTLAACTGNQVNETFCRDVRNVVAPVGDFPIPTQDTAVV